MADDLSAFRAKLAQISKRSDIIQSLSQTIRQAGTQDFLQAWLNAFPSAQSEDALLALIYVANDVIQLSGKDPQLKLRFASALGRGIATVKAKGARINSEIQRCLTIMKERGCLPLPVVGCLLQLLDATTDDAFEIIRRLDVETTAADVPATQSFPPQPLLAIPQIDAPTIDEQEQMRLEIVSLTPSTRPGVAIDCDAAAVAMVRSCRNGQGHLTPQERELLSWLRRLLSESKVRRKDIDLKTQRRKTEETRTHFLLFGKAQQTAAESSAAQRVAVLLRREFHSRRLKAEIDNALYYLLLDLIEYLTQRYSRLKHLVALCEDERRRRELVPSATTV